MSEHCYAVMKAGVRSLWWNTIEPNYLEVEESV